MPKVYASAENVEREATRLIPLYHPELATARFKYVFVDKASMENGRPVRGKIRKITGVLEFLLEADFMMEVALDQWNELADTQRSALIDHLLESCTGEEDESDGGGDMKWSTRKPDVQEFSAILRRHGAWNDDLSAFTSIAKTIEIDELVTEAADAVAETTAPPVEGAPRARRGRPRVTTTTTTAATEGVSSEPALEP
jgi:hypothetical protein